VKIENNTLSIYRSRSENIVKRCTYRVEKKEKKISLPNLNFYISLLFFVPDYHSIRMEKNGKIEQSGVL
jgi:hypothetical protein